MVTVLMNPRYKDERYDLAATFYRYPSGAFDNVKWTHWNDLADIYGTDSKGYAPSPSITTALQYGLKALEQGSIGVDEFLRLNACVGWLEGTGGLRAVGGQGTYPYDKPQHAAQRLLSRTGRHARSAPQRQRGRDAQGLRVGPGVHGSGLGIPMIDLRPYLDPELNMHNASAIVLGAGAPAGRQPRPGQSTR